MNSPFRYFNSSPEIIRLTVVMYIRYPLSLRQVEELLFERGIDICHETPGSQGCAKIPEAYDEALWPAWTDRDGPSSVLPGRDEIHRNRDASGMRSLAQQPGRKFTSAIPPARRSNDTI